MTKEEEAIKNIKEHCYFANLNPKAKKALDFAVKTLEQQPCEDAISRQAVLELVNADWKYEGLKSDIENLPPITPQTRWIPVSERLPKDFDTYLITLENGDVCQCDFNPDFWDEYNNREGAFTYNHQYFDPVTLGMIDEEEEAVDAIAWMPFEPYKAESEEYI